VSLIECVPNVSEGRRASVISALAAAVRNSSGVRLLDVSSDPAHNRTVLTMAAGEGAALQGAILELAAAALPLIDLREHHGVHPRMGAIDVVPFVPLQGVSMADCAALARDTARTLADQAGVPAYLYGEAAAVRQRVRLEDVRLDGFEGLAGRMRTERGRPDFGAQAPHPSAGATAVGARGILVAYNVELDTDRVDVARAVAAAVRERDGGLPAVKALGLALPDRGIVQVSMNLVDYRQTSIRQAWDAVVEAAARHGVDAAASELVGLAPRAALGPVDAEHVRLRATDASPILEDRLADAGLLPPDATL